MAKDTIFSRKKILKIGGRLLSLDEPLIMGILNITPDSFYAGSRKNNEIDILVTAEKMLSEGAAILDIGGYSSRPGAESISEKEEINRVVPVIKNIKKQFPDSIISIDTFRANIAKAAVSIGAEIINDISAGNLDDKMFETVAKLKVPYIIMHLKGTPKTMQQNAHYKYLIGEIILYFSEKINRLKLMGVSDIIIDPGFGFAKTSEQNFELIEKLKAFSIFGLPVLMGVSRKSTIQKILNCTAEEALNGTTVLNTILLQNGVNILRVHDVKAATEAVKLITEIKASPPQSRR